MSNLRQTVAARESFASKIEATLVAKFSKKIGLRRVRPSAKKVLYVVVVVGNQIVTKKTIA
jgi:hypothetical protein